MINPRLVLALLFVACFTGATMKETHPILGYEESASSSNGSVLTALMGDSRRLFANHFFAKADAYFHSGYYPTIFDNSAPKERSHIQTATEKDHDEHEEGKPEHHDEEESGFLGQPLDWIEAFGRNFFVSHHSHLATGNEREVLPWLKISADLDPQKVEIYVVASFWLRSKLGKVDEAENFLRDGLRANPDSPEILFELGRIRDENRHDTERARTLYELALQKWEKQKADNRKPDEFLYEQITIFLARLEERSGNIAKAILYLERGKEFSPAKETLEKQIEDLRKQLKSPGAIPKN